MRAAADGDNVRHAVSIQIATAQVLGRNLAIEHRSLPVVQGAIKVVHRNPVVLAAMACKHLVVAIAIDVGDPERMSVGERFVEHGAAAELGQALDARRALVSIAAR